LEYTGQAAALHESLSDIFAAAAEARADQGINADTWKLAEDVYTPGTPGDALRYLNDPALDGSIDFFPEYDPNAGPHANGGISNLAFYLLVAGGVHPRGKSTVVVPAVGMTIGQQIFYDALTSYLGAFATFGDLRLGAIQAAEVGYGSGSAEHQATEAAFCAVGMACPGGNNPPVCQDDSFTTPQDTRLSIFDSQLLSNDSDPDGDNLEVWVYDLDTSQGGENDCCHIGAFNYTPPLGFTGVDTFTYTIADRGDGTGLTASCTVSVTVTEINNPPDCLDDSLMGPRDTLLSIHYSLLLGNDSDPDGDGVWVIGWDPVTAEGGNTNPAPPGWIDYTPPPGYTGTDSFEYTITDRLDGTGLTATCTVTATLGPLTDRIGVYRPSSTQFILDLDASFDWTSGLDIVALYGEVGDLPVIGDWDGDGVDEIGVVDPGSQFVLDYDGCFTPTPDDVVASFGQAGDLPVIGDWNGDGRDDLGVYRPSTRQFILDSDGSYSQTPADVVAVYGFLDDLPISGDWNGDGVDDFGVYRPSTSQFILDSDGNRAWTTGVDAVVNYGIAPDDGPIIGDWNGDGIDDIGVYRASTRQFILDVDGSLSWSPGVDVVAKYGFVGDLPISGKWAAAGCQHAVAGHLEDRGGPRLVASASPQRLGDHLGFELPHPDGQCQSSGLHRLAFASVPAGARAPGW
jgi:hypothetical protein